jgi:hypothetical protein
MCELHVNSVEIPNVNNPILLFLDVMMLVGVLDTKINSIHFDKL